MRPQRLIRSAHPALRRRGIADRTSPLIVVGTPNETHYDLAKQALLAGKHVVIDKPFAATSAQAQELTEIAAERKLVLAPFHNRRWDGDFMTVRKVWILGDLGRVATFESHFDRFRPLPREATWKEASNDANGMLFDLGPHLVDQALALFGAPQAITASVRRDRDTTAIEDAFDITLHYPRLQAYLPGDHAGRRAGSAVPDPRNPRKLPQVRPRSAGACAARGRRHCSSHGRCPRLACGTGISLGDACYRTDPADPGELTRTTVKTELGDYRGYYANVRDAILGVRSLAGHAGGRLSCDSPARDGPESSASGRTLAVPF